MRSEAGSLKGQLLIAMPGMSDPFDRSVIYMCAHTSDAAMGLVVNRLVDHISFRDLLEQLNIKLEAPALQIRVHFGGPVELGRGHVLHSADYRQNASMVVDGSVALTASVSVLKAIAKGEGPRHCLLALGYAGWGPGQLDAEIQANAWLHAPADEEIVFSTDLESKWQQAVETLGVDIGLLSSEAGHA